jgi:hypothetical protein
MDGRIGNYRLERRLSYHPNETPSAYLATDTTEVYNFK